MAENICCNVSFFKNFLTDIVKKKLFVKRNSFIKKSFSLKNKLGKNNKL